MDLPAELKQTPHAREHALAELKAMGHIKRREWIMALTIVVLLVLWIFGKQLGVEAVVAAMVGLSILLVTGVLEWKSLVKIDNAWETLCGFLRAHHDGRHPQRIWRFDLVYDHGSSAFCRPTLDSRLPYFGVALLLHPLLLCELNRACHFDVPRLFRRQRSSLARRLC